MLLQRSFLVWIFQRIERVGRDRSEKLLSFYFCSQTIIEDGSILMLTLQTLLQFRICAAQFLNAAAAAMKL